MSPPLPVDHSPAPPPGPSPVRPALPPITRLLAPLMGLAAVVSLAAAQRSPEAAAETAYLAVAAGVPLLAAGAVALGVAVPVLGTGAVVALSWLVPTGPVRGALVGAVAAVVLTLAALDRAGLLDSGGTRRTDRLAELLRPVPALGLAFGLQAMLRGDELLSPPSAFFALVVYVALPTVGALATMALARLESPATAALATAAALAAGPGFRPASVVALVALATAPVALGRGLPPTLDRWRVASRAGAALLLLAPAVWSVEATALAAAAACVLALRDRTMTVAVSMAAALGAALALALLRSGGAGAAPEALAAGASGAMALVAVTAPAMIVASRRLPVVVASAFALAAAAALAVPVDGRLAAPVALAVAAVVAPPAGTGPWRGRAALPAPNDPRAIPMAIQGVWTATLLSGATIAGSYPWLRIEPLISALGLLGLPSDWSGALPVLAGATVLIGVAGIASEVPAVGPAGARRVAAAATAGAVVLLLAAGAHEPGLVLVDEKAPLVLRAPSTTWTGPLDPTAVGSGPESLVLDSSLANAVGLPHGTPVATVTLRGADGPVRSWTVHAGEETGEWAVDRPDLADPDMVPAPKPWISWINAEPRFYGHRYRALLAAETGGRIPAAGEGPPDRLELRLRPDLPPEVVLTIFRLEVRP